MAKEIKTHILCYDDHRGFTEDIRKRFTDTARYTVLSFQNREEFLAHFKEQKENKFYKVVILGLHDSKEQIEMIDHLTIETKKLYPGTGLILLGPPEKMEEIKKIVKFNIDAYIPKNSNSVLRIHNAVKKLISEHNIAIFRRRRNFSLYALLTFVILSVLLILISYFRFPGYF